VNRFTVTTTISLPREEVFEYLADIGDQAEFWDHYWVDWHLLRQDSYGTGAGARFRIKAPFNRFSWGDMSMAEVTAPFRILMRGRSGKFNRIRMIGIYTLSIGPGATTTVEYSFETAPQLLTDRLMEALGGAFWTRRQVTRAIRRLRIVLEEGRDRGRRPTVAAG
jgi:uncharacterized protein YndB with AHSA1/START domain